MLAQGYKTLQDQKPYLLFTTIIILYEDIRAMTIIANKDLFNKKTNATGDGSPVAHLCGTSDAAMHMVL